MELGGNAPFIVFADADVDAAVSGAVLAKMRNGGAACTAANRFYVARQVYGQFVEKLTYRIEAMKVGRGTDPTVAVGPVIDEVQRDRLNVLVADAQARGAHVHYAGTTLPKDGHFFAPAVVTGIAPGARLLREEIFGPVAPVMAFDDAEEAIASANDTDQGLVGYVYTNDVARALRCTDRLQTGMVGLNRGLVSDPAAPFGGIKSSGFGREGGAAGIDEYLQIKYLAMDG